MASFVYAVWSITNVASVHCSVRPEISPCTCEPIFASKRVELSCEKVDSFHQIVDALSDKFTSNISISLLIAHSQLDDLEMRSFGEMNLNVKKLRMISDNLRSVPELPFRGLSNVEYLSFAENDLDEIPKHVLNHLPKISTLDLGKGRIRAVNQDDLKGIPLVRYLILVTNNITRLDKGSFPPNLLSLHLGRNQISTLNGTLRELYDLESLFINMNNITSLDNELPASQNLKFILAQNNSLERLPESLKNMPKLESLFFQNNNLKSFNGVLRNAKKMSILKAFHNQIEYLAKDEFLQAEYMDEMDLAYNNIKSLNNSLLPMKRLRSANFSFNEMEEFAMSEIRGLEYLTSLDISYNRIKKLYGHSENNIEPSAYLVDLQINHNRLKSLDGALAGLSKLKMLSLTHNEIERILPNDFSGLKSLEILDLSNNQLLTLQETAKTCLPSLKILKVAFNNLTKLERDFHGLPVLCQANLMHNQITSLSADLVSQTRCTNHGVPGKLEIWLENNPIMCDERINELCPIMQAQESRIRGKSQCVENDLEVCTDPPIILQAPLALVPQIIQNQFHQVANGKPMVQVIVPAPALVPSKQLIKADLLPIITPIASVPIKVTPTTPIITTTTTTTTSSSSSSSTTTTTTTESPITTTTTTSSSQFQPISTISDLSNKHINIETEYPAINYSPIVQMEPGPPSSSEGDDNSVHKQFSPIFLSEVENSKSLLLQEEPPEMPQEHFK